MSQTPQSQPVVLVDGSSYLFRAYHALPPLTNSKGLATGAIKGVSNMLRRLQKDYPESRLIVIFDAKGKNFRHDLYPEYKANRPPMPEDLREQIAPLHELVDAMGLPVVVIPGVEADDVIGTLSRQAEKLGWPTVISTGDKDMAQLVSEQVTLINTMNDTRMDREGVQEKFGVQPSQIIDYLALVGDSVDNIPGVPKCGPKTAVKWLSQYHSLDALMENADQIGGKIGENLRNALPQLPLSRDLATIRCELELPEPLEAIQGKPIDNEQLSKLLESLEFKGWLKELSQADPADNAVDEAEAPAESIDTSQYQAVQSPEAFDAMMASLGAAEVFAFDTETDALNYRQARLVGISVATAPNQAYYVPLRHDAMAVDTQLPVEQVLTALKPLLEDARCKKVAQNAKYDAHIMAHEGIQLAGFEDTMLLSYVLDPTANRHDMDTLSEKWLGHTPIAFTDVAGKKGPKQLTFDQVPLVPATAYAAEDADVTLRLYQRLSQAISEQPNLDKLYAELERPLHEVLTRMEDDGAKINEQALKQQSQEIAERLAELEQRAYELAGQEFNLGSPKQLQEIFYSKLGFEVLKKTPKGQPSTAEPVLIELAEKYELPQVLLEHRGLAKLKSTYTDKLPEMVDPASGRVHTSYHQAVTATGRLSSSEPNLQNIPIRTAEGRRIREAFVAEPGNLLVSADYSQIELRLMAHLSADTTLCEAFAKGLDVHRATAAEVFDIPLAEVSDDQRRKAKAINFGLIYGMSAFGLARQLKLERREAQDYIDRYFERYPGVRDYMDRIRKTAHEQGYVETLFGRRLYLPDIQSRNRQLQQAAERLAINAPMQGSAADLIKRAMLAVDAWLRAEHPDCRMIMQVHDELILEVPEAKAQALADSLCNRMAAAAELKVPLIADAGIGTDWGQAH